MSKTFGGIYAAAVTPFTQNGAPDTGQLTGLVEHLRSKGCTGILICGSTGEGQSLSVSERCAVVESAARVKKGLKLLVGTGAASIEDTIILTHAAFDIGADGVVIIPPFFFKSVTDQGLVEYYSEVINRAFPSNGRMLLYHNPILTSTAISIGVIRTLVSKFPNNVVGIKDSGSDLDYAKSICAEFPNFELLVGDDRLLSRALEFGASGAITGLSNLFPDLLAQVLLAYLNKRDTTKAQLRIDTAYKKLDGLPRIAAIKELLVVGKLMLNSRVRPPLHALSTSELDVLRNRFNFHKSDGLEALPDSSATSL